MPRPKGLGRLLKVKPHCYAAALGGCSEKLSQEHPLSAVLRLGKTLRVVVRRQLPGASKSQQTLSRDIDIRQACAPVLCEAHNTALSAIDSEAAKLSAALQEVGRRSRSRIVQPYEAVSINGRFFGAWLCKFDCGSMAMTGQQPHPDFVRYAFGNETVVVTSFSPSGVNMAEVYAELPDGVAMIDRLRRIEYEDALRFRITIDWGQDTDESWIVNPAGRPVARRE